MSSQWALGLCLSCRFPMSPKAKSIWIWQRIVTPHMVGLADSLAEQGCSVVYVAEQPMSEDRAREGWVPATLHSAALRLAPTRAAVIDLVESAPADSVHICQGIRSNGLVAKAQQALSKRGLRQWVIMEMVDDQGARGILKRLVYRWLFAKSRGHVEGVLAIGHRTPAWVIARGIPASLVFPFAYFLPDAVAPICRKKDRSAPFRFTFVGRLIELKRVEMLIAALAAARLENVELEVVGSGPLEPELRRLSDELLPGRVVWTGRLPASQIANAMARADCLVLPSRHDGWGAVVSEALMAGTPVICSDACGSAGVVEASGSGGVFASDDVQGLRDLIRSVVKRGPLSDKDRSALAHWAHGLGSDAGARYLAAVLDYSAAGHGPRPPSPWSTKLAPNVSKSAAMVGHAQGIHTASPT